MEAGSGQRDATCRFGLDESVCVERDQRLGGWAGGPGGSGGVRRRAAGAVLRPMTGIRVSPSVTVTGRAAACSPVVNDPGSCGEVMRHRPVFSMFLGALRCLGPWLLFGDAVQRRGNGKRDRRCRIDGRMTSSYHLLPLHKAGLLLGSLAGAMDFLRQAADPDDVESRGPSQTFLALSRESNSRGTPAVARNGGESRRQDCFSSPTVSPRDRSSETPAGREPVQV